MVTITSTGYIWIPPLNHPNWKIQITRKGGTVDNVTSYVHQAELTWGATEVVGNFSIVLDNLDESYSNAYEGGEIVEFFLDYLNATTKIFKGIIDKVGYAKDPLIKINIKGRHYAIKLMSLTVTKSYTNIETSVILKSLFSSYAPAEFTTTNVNTSTTNLTIAWTNKPFWDCIIELCNAAGFDAYIDASLDCHYFLQKSIQNTTDAIVHDDNLSNVSDFGKDTAEVRNRVIIYGQNISNTPLMSFAEDTTAQSNLFIKEEVITDTNVTTMTQAQERASDELARLKEGIEKGDVEAYPGLATLKPGETLFISDPANNLITFYKVISFTHSFSESGLTTKVTIERSSISTARIFKERLEAEQRLSNVSNPYEMRYSYNEGFDDSSNIESKTTIDIKDSCAVIRSAYTEGVLTIKAVTTPTNITQFELRVDGSDLADSIFEVSCNNGVNWEVVTRNTLISAPSTTGNRLKVRVTLYSTWHNAQPKLDAIAVLYRCD